MTDTTDRLRAYEIAAAFAHDQGNLHELADRILGLTRIECGPPTIIIDTEGDEIAFLVTEREVADGLLAAREEGWNDLRSILVAKLRDLRNAKPGDRHAISNMLDRGYKPEQYETLRRFVASFHFDRATSARDDLARKAKG